MPVYKRDDYLDHWSKRGLITQMILAQCEKHSEKDPDPGALKAIFLNAECPDIAAMAEYLGTLKGRRFGGFGTGSIMPEGTTTNTPLSAKIASDLRGISIGTGEIRPLEWLGYFARDIDQIPADARKVVNDLCQLVIISMRDLE